MPAFEEIYIKGAKSNNLKNIDVALPKNKLIVVTGLSGSGKSSLVMDTLFAEGQRRYVESLSSYARQFLSRMKKPEVDYIHGICPAIAIEQRVSSGNARSTVGSMTEIYDYLRLLYARIGKVISPISGQQVKRHTVEDVVNGMLALPAKTKVHLTSPLSKTYGDRIFRTHLDLLLQQGYTRVYYRKQSKNIQDLLESNSKNLEKPLSEIKGYELLVDRFVINPDSEDLRKRMTDSAQTAFDQGDGECTFHTEKKKHGFNNRFELDGLTFVDPTPQLFNYNNPVGACPTCEGYGRVIGIDPDKVIPNPALSLYEGAIVPWRSEKGKPWQKRLLLQAESNDIPIHKPYRELTKEQKKKIWKGSGSLWGIDEYFDSLREKMYKIQNRILLARYRGRTVCPDCDGARLNQQALCVQVAGKKISELIDLPITELADHFNGLQLSKSDDAIGNRIILEVQNRLQTMLDVGLGYLTLDRLSKTLSGGETQRIHLTRTLGSNLTDSLYILDEPSIGLHPKDTDKLIKVLKKLRDLNNTVLVVEHEEAVIREADYIIDMGPGAGMHGGNVCYAGEYKKFLKAKKNLTASYLIGQTQVPLPDRRRPQVNHIHIEQAALNNLKNVSVTIPLHNFSVVTGVSGSGKSTLVRDILYPKLQNLVELTNVYSIDQLSGDLRQIDEVEFIGQNALGKSSRSNPVTYVKAFDKIRKIMAKQAYAKMNGFTASDFSFNREGGRCEACQGEGFITVEMQFLADVQLVCEECNGRRYKDSILEVRHKNKAIDEILNLSVEESLDFFKDDKDIVQKLKPLYDVGLGYIRLGQSSSTLSGGEAQRLKLASYLVKEHSDKHIFFIFDEPTTGLHFQDVEKLVGAFQSLVDKGHSLLVVEHNLDLIKCADWIIDLGPEGGKNGGQLLYQGPLEGIKNSNESVTGYFLNDKI